MDPLLDPHLAARNESWRKQRKLSKAALALKAGVDAETVTAFLAGAPMPGRVLKALLSALDITRQEYLADPAQAMRLEFWRRKRGLTKTELALLVGVDKSTITRWTTGQAMMPRSLDRCLRALRITLGEYLQTDLHRAV